MSFESFFLLGHSALIFKIYLYIVNNERRSVLYISLVCHLPFNIFVWNNKNLNYYSIKSLNTVFLKINFIHN